MNTSKGEEIHSQHKIGLTELEIGLRMNFFTFGSIHQLELNIFPTFILYLKQTVLVMSLLGYYHIMVKQ
jgi:hypothetical protein